VNGHLSPQDRHRLARLLGMTGSAHDGETLNAARLADRLVKDRGATWSEVLAAAPVHRELLDSNWRTTCAKLVRREGDLCPRERQFVANLPRFQRISTRQRIWLESIAARVLGGRP
jgi:hypothetical protein